MAGREIDASHFPLLIGRAAKADLRLDDIGVWDRHLVLFLDPEKGISLKIQESAHASINGQSFEQAIMRNGDIVELGAVKLRFWLAKARRYNLVWREWMVWAIVTGIALTQIAIIYWLTFAE